MRTFSSKISPVNNILQLIKLEEERQRDTLMMIPSENYTYPEVRRAVGSVLMHKYSEGYPKKRYYQGNSNIDEIETLCQRYALEAFHLNSNKWHVNVQTLSGSPANLAVYNAVLSPGDTIMAMYLPDGGHLSHGWVYKDKKITFTSKIFNIVHYHVDPKTGLFDYGKIEKQALGVRPKLLISGGTAYPREINHLAMSEIAKKTGAYYLADIAHEAGLVAADINGSPFAANADFVTMTTHKTLRGPRGALVFCKKEFAEALDASVFPGLQGGPHNHTIAGIAIALQKAQTAAFAKYAFRTVQNAQTLAAELQKAGLEVATGGTDKHLILLDLRGEKTNGWFAGWALEKAGIVANRNTIPNDKASPYYPSGLRLGTPALTARGMGIGEMKMIASWISAVIDHVGERTVPQDQQERQKTLKDFKEEISNDKLFKKISREVKSLCNKFPIDF